MELNAPNTLQCPVRGAVPVRIQDPTLIHTSEEFQIISCVKFLLSKGYPEDMFEFEKKIEVGSGNKPICLDISLKTPKKRVLVVKIKKTGADKTSVVKSQLIPAMNRAGAEFGIYWNGTNKILFRASKEYPIARLPDFGKRWEDKELTRDDLRPIDHPHFLLDILNQTLHNMAGASKHYRYQILLSLLLIKFHDEEVTEGGGGAKILYFQCRQ